ncbi:MAG: S41 family peptidase [Hyphomicrobiaceae bacterium]
MFIPKSTRNPETSFEELWWTFHNRYPFFELRRVDWKKQYEIFRPRVTSTTSDAELFDLLCQMLAPLNDGHVELEGRVDGRRRFFTAEEKPKFYREFSDEEIKALFKTTERTLIANGFSPLAGTDAWMLRYCRSGQVGYMRILELEDVKKPQLAAALDKIAGDFRQLAGFIIDIRDCPGGEDSIAIAIINRFCDRKRVAFHRKTKTGPGEDEYTSLSTRHIEPQGDVQFTGPVVLLACDTVFSGGESFALAIKQLPHVTIVGDHTNGIFSYTLDKKLPNGWKYCLSYQVYYSPDMVCYEGKGVPPDIELLNKKADIDSGVDPLIVKALEVLGPKRIA